MTASGRVRIWHLVLRCPHFSKAWHHSLRYKPKRDLLDSLGNVICAHYWGQKEVLGECTTQVLQRSRTNRIDRYLLSASWRDRKASGVWRPESQECPGMLDEAGDGEHPSCTSCLCLLVVFRCLPGWVMALALVRAIFFTWSVASEANFFQKHPHRYTPKIMFYQLSGGIP